MVIPYMIFLLPLTIDAYHLAGYGQYCSDPSTRITTRADCQAAATALGLNWGNGWWGPTDFAGCLHSRDSRNKVYFNYSPHASSDPSVNRNYAEICTGSGEAKIPHTYLCYFHPGCDFEHYCKWGYFCCHDNYCCRSFDPYGPICPRYEKDVLPYTKCSLTQVSSGTSGIKQKQVNQNANMALTCLSGNQLYIKSAQYTKQGDPYCKNDFNANLNTVRSICQNQRSCVIPATNEKFGNPCPHVLKTLTVVYSCTGMRSLDPQEFQDFQNAAIMKYDNGEITLDHGGCSLRTWWKCLYDGYKYYSECKIICNGNYKCIIKCMIEKFKNNPKCKACLKALLKAICCHFIPSSPCCDMTDDEFTNNYITDTTPVPICDTVNEFQTLQISCATGTTINITYALYGRLNPPCGNAVLSKKIVNTYCQGKEDCAVAATSGVFGDVECIPVLTICHTCEN